MKRRDLLKAGLAGAFTLATPLLASPPLELPAGSFCRSPRNRAIKVKCGPNDLTYQGTHILTHGALAAISRSYQGPGGGHLLVTGGGCDDGIAAVREGRAILGGMCCPVRGSKAEGMPWRQVAWDIKMVVAHPATRVDTVSTDQLRLLSHGSIDNWSQLDGENRPIALVVRRHCPDKFEPVRQLLLDGDTDWSPRALWVETDQQLVDTVSRFPGAVGLVSKVFAEPLLARRKLKAMRVDDIAPSREAVQMGAYQLKGPLNLVFREWQPSRMQPFFDFLQTSHGKRLLGRLLVPVSVREGTLQHA